MSGWLRTFVVFGVFGLCAASRMRAAEIESAMLFPPVNAPEIVALDADQVVRVTNLSIDANATGGSWWHVHGRVVEVLKGDARPGPIEFGAYDEREVLKAIDLGKTEWVFCLTKPSRFRVATRGGIAAPPPPAELAAGWITPQPGDGPCYWLLQPNETDDTPWIVAGPSFLRRLHRALAAHPNGLAGVPVAWVLRRAGADAWWRERVPLTPELAAIGYAMAKSAEPIERRLAVGILGAERTPATVAALRGLLADPSFQAPSTTDKWYTRHYPVRVEARDALLAMGVTVNRAVIDEPADDAVTFSPAAWGWVLGALIVSLGVIGAASSLGRGGGAWGRISGAVVVWSTALCVALTALWVRSHWAATQIELDRPPGRRVEWCASPRGLQWTTVDKMTVAGGARLVSLPAHTDFDCLWTAPPLDADFMGATWLGRGHGNAVVTKYDWTMTIVPYWWPTLLSGAMPAVVLGGAAVRRRRRARSRCAECGYDLRASEHRCPECGQPIPEPKPSWQAVVHEQRLAEQALRRHEDLRRQVLAERLDHLRE